MKMKAKLLLLVNRLGHTGDFLLFFGSMTGGFAFGATLSGQWWGALLGVILGAFVGFIERTRP